MADVKALKHELALARIARAQRKQAQRLKWLDMKQDIQSEKTIKRVYESMGRRFK